MTTQLQLNILLLLFNCSKPTVKNHYLQLNILLLILLLLVVVLVVVVFNCGKPTVENLH